MLLGQPPGGWPAVGGALAFAPSAYPSLLDRFGSYRLQPYGLPPMPPPVAPVPLWGSAPAGFALPPAVADWQQRMLGQTGQHGLPARRFGDGAMPDAYAQLLQDPRMAMLLYLQGHGGLPRSSGHRFARGQRGGEGGWGRGAVNHGGGSTGYGGSYGPGDRTFRDPGSSLLGHI